MTEKADITMPELAAELAAARGEKADPAWLSRWLIRAGYRFKKLCGRASKIAPTSEKRARNGRRRANPGCGLSLTAWSFSMRPEPRPR